MDEGLKYFYDEVTPVNNMVVRDATELTIPMVQNLYKWWHSFTSDIPLKSDFDIVDHIKSAANIFLIEVLGPGEYHFTVVGQTVVDIVGTNNNGTHFKFAESPQDEREERHNDLISYYDKIVKERCCMSCQGTVFFMSKRHQEYESLDCPLVDADGKVTHLLGIISLVG